jgi:hypothetical protein
LKERQQEMTRSDKKNERMKRRKRLEERITESVRGTSRLSWEHDCFYLYLLPLRAVEGTPPAPRDFGPNMKNSDIPRRRDGDMLKNKEDEDAASEVCRRPSSILRRPIFL